MKKRQRRRANLIKYMAWPHRNVVERKERNPTHICLFKVGKSNHVWAFQKKSGTHVQVEYKTSRDANYWLFTHIHALNFLASWALKFEWFLLQKYFLCGCEQEESKVHSPWDWVSILEFFKLMQDKSIWPFVSDPPVRVELDRKWSHFVAGEVYNISCKVLGSRPPAATTIFIGSSQLRQIKYQVSSCNVL